jgi:hypothetical protein
MVRELLDRETDSAKKVRSDEISRTNFDFVFLNERTLGSFLSTFWGSSRSGRISTSCAGKSGWMRALPLPMNSRSTRQEPVLLDHKPSSHNAIRATERYVGTRFVRRYRDPLLGRLHIRWPKYLILRVHLRCAEIAMCDNVWMVGHPKVEVRQKRHAGKAAVSASLFQNSATTEFMNGMELRGKLPLRTRRLLVV